MAGSFSDIFTLNGDRERRALLDNISAILKDIEILGVGTGI